MTLTPGQWLAMMGWHTSKPEEREPSVIRILRVQPQGTGKGLLELEFYHANYPEGVRHKSYVMQVIARRPNFLISLLEDGGTEDRVLLLHRPTLHWFRKFFPEFQPNATSLEQIVAALERDFNGGSSR